ncbi:hypothetical protein [uncultured Cohaesibacter sp.]|uniref:hypothetical protein n=1 Tax=uncultured Cohaesibacter sp. TaxID=1002546 RepID=UPI0029C7014B|nr:hypothetical protein [uncultured Cohaesibacter sp.]
MKRFLSPIIFACIITSPCLGHADDYDFGRAITAKNANMKEYGISSAHDYKRILNRKELQDCVSANKLRKLKEWIDKEKSSLSKIAKDLKSIRKKIRSDDNKRMNKWRYAMRLYNDKVDRMNAKINSYNRSIQKQDNMSELLFGMSCKGTLYYSSDKPGFKPKQTKNEQVSIPPSNQDANLKPKPLNESAKTDPNKALGNLLKSSARIKLFRSYRGPEYQDAVRDCKIALYDIIQMKNGQSDLDPRICSVTGNLYQSSWDQFNCVVKATKQRKEWRQSCRFQ